MDKADLQINSIFEGHAPSQYFGKDGSFVSSIAIDPDYPISSSDVKTSGFMVPIGHAIFSGANVTGAPMALITNPKNTLTYAILANGRFISYSSSLASETLIGTVTGNTASGGFYYNNYIYILGTNSGVDVARYGPLNNSPSLTNAVWTGATLGSLTALTNTTYPTLQGVSLPNHWGHVHGDSCAYFTDFKNGQGLIHKISTKKVTDEGDTNGTVVPSAYNVLDLPFGFYPTDLTSVSTNLLITGIMTTDTTVNQGDSAFVVWDPTNTTSFFLGPVPLPDSLATATFNKNGKVFIFTGNSQNGSRVSQYLGGEETKDIVFQEEGMPPFPGAVGAMGSRLVWGGFTTNPSTGATVYAYGSKDGNLPAGLHNIIKTSSAGATPIVTALARVQQSSYKQPKWVTGWHDASASGIDQYSGSATLASNIRFMFNIGQKFQIMKIRIPLAGAVDANTTITPKIYFDDLSSNKSLSVINNTNYPSKRKVIYKGPALQDYVGLNNFVLELAWTGTTPLPVALPIKIWIDIKEDEPQ